MQATAQDRSNIEIPYWFDDKLRSDLINKINRERGCLSFIDTLVYSFLALIHRQSSAWRYTKPYSWAELEHFIKEDCLQICASDFSPDVVVGVKSGGAFIARYVAGCLDVKKIVYIKVGHYHPVFGSICLAYLLRYFRQPQLTQSFSADLCNARVLLVDDQIRSGKTLRVARQWVEKQGAAEVKTYCMLTQGAMTDFGNRSGVMINTPWGDDP